MEKAIELVFIPFPTMGHFVSMVQLAKLFLQRRENLSITFLIMKLPFIPPTSKINSYIQSLLAQNDEPRLKLVPLPEDLDDAMKAHTDVTTFLRVFLDLQMPKVKECVGNEVTTTRLAGFVVDALCTNMIDVASDEFGVPTYVFYALGTAFLGLHFHLQSLRDDHGIDAKEFKDSDPDLDVPTYSEPFPVKLLPNLVVDLTGGYLDAAKGMRRAEGVIVNTFLELEQHALASLAEDKNVPRVYPLGPILNLNVDHESLSEKEIFEWLDDQPPSSVVFLCFGSGGGNFSEPQLKEIAHALERSGQRFLWTLRPSQLESSNNNLEEVLPKGFLERTISIGKVIGWAPQVAVLSHASVGGFVSHCGWNSVLESIWNGVPVGTWPIGSDQPANAFQLIKEIGMGVDVKMDYKSESRDPLTNSLGPPELVNADEIEIGIASLMDKTATNSIRKRANEVKEKSKQALKEGGSSFNLVESFLEHVMNNLK